MASKQSVIELKLKGAEESLNLLVKLKEESRAFGTEITATRKQIKEFAAQGKDTKQLEEKILSLRKAQEKLNGTIGETRKEINSQNKAFESAKFPKDSIIGMEQEYAKLRKQIRELSAEERNSPFGQGLIKQSRGIKDNIRDVNTSLGDTTQNVGNYREAIEMALKGQGSFLSNLKSATGTMLQGALLGGGVALVGTAVSAMNEFISSARQVYEESKGIDFAFNRIEKGSNILSAAIDRTNGLLSKMEIKKAAVEFNNFGLNLEALPTLLEFVAVRAGQTGKSFEYLRDSLIEGLSKQSTLRIDNLGISASRLKEELKQTPDFVMAVAKIAQEEIGKAGNVIDAATTSQRKYNVAIENAKVVFGKWYSESIKPIIGGFANFITKITEAEEKTETQKEKYDKLIVGANTLFSVLEDVNKTLQKSKKGSLEYSTALDTKSKLIKDINSQYGEYLPNLLSEKASIEQIKDAQQVLNKSLLQKQIIMAYEEEITKAIKQELDARKNLVVINTMEVTGGYEKMMTDLSAQGASSGQVDAMRQLQNQMIKAGKDINTGAIHQAQETQTKVTETYKKMAKDSGFVWESLLKELDLKSKQISGNVSNSKGKGAKETGLVEGSIEYLEKRISDLKKSLESEVKDDAGIKKTLKEITEYEFKLKTLKEILEQAKTENDLLTQSQLRLVKALTTTGLNNTENTTGRLDPKNIPASIEKKAQKERLSFEEWINQQIFESRKKSSQAARDEELKNTEEVFKKKEDGELELREFKIAVARNVSTGLIQIEQNIVEQKQSKELDSAQKVYDEKIAKAQGNKAIEEAAAKELATKKAQIEKEAAKRRKAIAYQEAIIQGALSMIEVSGQPFKMALVAITTAMNLAVISSTQFAKGGFTGKAKGNVAPDSSGLRPVGIVHEGEYVVSPAKTAKYNAMLQALDKDDEVGMQRAFYKSVMQSKSFDKMINEPPPAMHQLIYKAELQNNNAGIEKRLESLNNAMVNKLSEVNFKLESVILALSEHERILERKGRLK